jgi:hypothetical protein
MSPLKVTDVPEKVIAQYAKMLSIDAVDVIDRLVIRGDNILLSLHGLADGEEVPWAWIWSRQDEEEYDEAEW